MDTAPASVPPVKKPASEELVPQEAAPATTAKAKAKVVGKASASSAKAPALGSSESVVPQAQPLISVKIESSESVSPPAQTTPITTAESSESVSPPALTKPKDEASGSVPAQPAVEVKVESSGSVSPPAQALLQASPESSGRVSLPALRIGEPNVPLGGIITMDTTPASSSDTVNEVILSRPVAEASILEPTSLERGVVFDSRASATNAQSMLDGTEIGSNVIRVVRPWFAQTSSRMLQRSSQLRAINSELGLRLVIRNLPLDCSEAELRAHMETAGAVIECLVDRPFPSLESPNSCFHYQGLRMSGNVQLRHQSVRQQRQKVET